MLPRAVASLADAGEERVLAGQSHHVVAATQHQHDIEVFRALLQLLLEIHVPRAIDRAVDSAQVWMRSADHPGHAVRRRARTRPHRRAVADHEEAGDGRGGLGLERVASGDQLLRYLQARVRAARHSQERDHSGDA